MGSSSSVASRSARPNRPDEERGRLSLNGVGGRISNFFSSPASTTSAKRLAVSREQSQENFVHSTELFSTDFLSQISRLVHDEMESGMYLAFLSNRLWKDLLFPDLKLKLMQSTFAHLSSTQNQYTDLTAAARKIVMDETFPGYSQKSNIFSLKGILKYLDMNELRSFFIAVTLSCYFQYRSHLDFAQDTKFQPATSREGLLNSLYLRKQELPSLERYENEVKALTKTLEENNEERIVDPEMIMTLISLQSQSDDFSSLLFSGEWQQAVVSGMEKLGFSITIWDLNNLPEEPQEIASDLPILYSNKINAYSASQYFLDHQDSSSSSGAFSLVSQPGGDEEVRTTIPVFPSANSLPVDGPTANQLDLEKQLAEKQRNAHNMVCARKELKFLKNYFNARHYQEKNCPVPKFIQFYQQALQQNESLKMVIKNNALGNDFKEPLFFGLLPIANCSKNRSDRCDPENHNYLVTIHCPLNILTTDKLFYGMIDFLFFCVGGIQQQNHL